MNDKWIDIIPPVAPVETLPAWFWLCLVALLLSLFFLYSWHQSDKQKGLRKLKTLIQQFNNNVDIQNIPTNLRTTLKQCFNVNNIDHIRIQDTSDWLNFKQRLVTSCFSNKQLKKKEIQQLLSETQYWIRHGASK